MRSLFIIIILYQYKVFDIVIDSECLKLLKYLNVKLASRLWEIFYVI